MGAAKSKWETLPKVVEKDRAKMLSNFKIQTDKLVIANQLDIVVVDKLQEKAVVIEERSAVWEMSKKLRKALKLPGIW